MKKIYLKFFLSLIISTYQTNNVESSEYKALSTPLPEGPIPSHDIEHHRRVVAIDEVLQPYSELLASEAKKIERRLSSFLGPIRSDQPVFYKDGSRTLKYDNPLKILHMILISPTNTFKTVEKNEFSNSTKKQSIEEKVYVK